MGKRLLLVRFGLLSFVGLLALTACHPLQRLQPTADATLPTATTPGSTSAECDNPVPEDRQFPLPPWPDTDFCRHSVSYDEITFGGVHRDRIPAIDEPVFQSLEEANVWLADVEPVLALELDGDARAYPLQVLVWHEIVNDTVGGVPAVITYCPLCNSGLAFERRADGRILDFGVSGNLRRANLIMYDRQTESWWQQFTGEAIVGAMTGAQLRLLPVHLVSYGDFKARFPQGRVLFPDTGYERPYGETPYVTYDSPVNPRAGWLQGEPDPRLHPKMRVLALDIGDTAIAYPYETLREERVINDRQAGEAVVIFWKSGTTSALYKTVIAESRDVGSAAAYSRMVRGRMLTFVADGTQFRDLETGSTWNLLGLATQGPLAGEQLRPLQGHEFLWFAWAAFRPDTLIHGQE